jgi:hypothetical protein
MLNSYYEESAVAFLKEYPVDSPVNSIHLIEFAKKKGNGLATDLLIADRAKQVSAIRRHLNSGGASSGLKENQRFHLRVEDAKAGTMMVVPYVEYVRSIAEDTTAKMIGGAMAPLKRSRRAINDVKLDEVSAEMRKTLEDELAEIVEMATPLSAMLGTVATNRWVRRLTAKGYSEQVARSLIETLPTLQREIKLIKAAKF